MSPRTIALALAASLASAAHAAAPITYDQALRASAAQAPALRAAELQAEAANAAAVAAGRLPDPKLGAGLDNYPVSGPMAGRPGAEQMTMARIGFSQDVPSAAKRRAQVGRAQADIAAANADAAVVAQQVRLQTALAWTDLYFAQKKLAALDAILARLAPLWDTAPAGVASGRTRPAQALEAAQARAALEDRRSEARADLARAQAQLRRWTGAEDLVAVGAPPDASLDAATMRANLDRRPRLLVLDAASRQAGADLALAKAETRPDWTWEVAYQRRDPMFGDMLSAGVAISLPLWGKTRQAPMIRARAAGVGRAQAQREDARRALESELDADLADHVMHHDRWVRARDVLVPLAKQRADLETAAYGAGATGLADVLAAFSNLADAQLDMLGREAAVAADSARLRLTYEDQDQ